MYVYIYIYIYIHIYIYIYILILILGAGFRWVAFERDATSDKESQRWPGRGGGTCLMTSWIIAHDHVNSLINSIIFAVGVGGAPCGPRHLFSYKRL